MENFLNYLVSKEFLETIVVIAIAVAALVFVKQILIKKVAYKSRHEKMNTVDGLIFNLLQYIIILVAIFVVLTVNGINVTGMLAGLGIAATIIGLSLQDTFKDLFAGINIYGNNFYKVGDYVKYENELCIVKFFNGRVTKFQSASTGSTYTVSNSSINSIEKIKKNTSISFYFDFDVDRKQVDEALEAVTKTMKETKGCESATYYSLIAILDRGVRYLIGFSANPQAQDDVKIAAYQKAYTEFKAREIAPLFDGDRDIVISDKEKYYSTKSKSSTRRTHKNVKTKAKTKKK